MSSSAQRALKILEIVSRSESAVGVSAIAKRAGIVPGTAYRSLDALERRGYIMRFQASTRYVRGETTKRLRQSVFAGFHLRDVCTPYMHRLALMTSETTTLIVPVGWYGVCIAGTAGTNEVRSAPMIGAVRPMSDHFAARLILAFLPDEKRARYRSWAKRLGLKGTGRALDAMLLAIRSAGYSTESTEFAPGKAAMALPIRSQGQAIAAIAIDGPVVTSGSGSLVAQIEPWLEVVRMIEQRVAERAELFRNPFGHIDPDKIVLPIS